MKLADLAEEDAWALQSWLAEALGRSFQRRNEQHPPRVELHVFAQGYELRCGELNPFKIEPFPL